ncbi:MAG: UDP-N-acetylmuramate--L-alanine ligase [Eubacteriales bacterium]|jgi:UDP-N-acetylmuramate--alanine ligase|nr:UDP-N-acetylmuramate--L-alanine ligase [Eubacteriales bacterium]
MAHIDDAKRIHLIGIGGCSMNGLALILKSQGHEVTGSDRERSQFTDALDHEGVRYSIGHTGEYIDGADLVVFSAAIKPDNPERVLAREKGIPELERSVALGQISERYAQVVAIAGCHGKTTITSMLAIIHAQAKTDATIHVGGFVDFLEGGVHVGNRELFVTEACEYVESFLTLKPTVALINNIDDDHLDYYKDIDEIVAVFERFLALLPEDGTFIACVDDVRVKALVDKSDLNIVTYGLTGGDYTASDIAFDARGNAGFTVLRRGEAIGTVQLSVPGMHNVVNALGAVAVSDHFGVSFDVQAQALHDFQNTRRRFEFYGEHNGVRVFHDYGHHPSEIRATLDAAKRVPHKTLYCVFQCNSYTRARTLFCNNVTCFTDADHVLVPDIYPGREKDTGIVHARDMVQAINEQSHNAVYIPTFEEIRLYLDEHASEGDLVVTVGSGDVYRQTRKLL